MRVFFLLLVSLSIVPAVTAQQGADTTACTYERCVLRVERSLLGSRVLRGQPGEAVGASGLKSLFDPEARDFELTEAVSTSPEALSHAFAYERRSRTVGYVSLGASVALLTAAVAVVMGPKYTRVSQAGAVGYLGLTAVSIPLQRRANRSFAQAIEAYNASLPREQ